MAAVDRVGHMVLLTFISIIAIALLLHPRFRAWHKANEPAFNFLVAVVATFCGVAWAIALEKPARERAEKEEVVRLLRAADRGLEDRAVWLAMRATATKYIDFFRVEDGLPPTEDAPIENKASEGVLAYALRNNLVLKHTSPEGLHELWNGETRLELHDVGYRAMSDSIRKANGEYLSNREGMECMHLHYVLRAGIDFQRGKIDKKLLKQTIAYLNSGEGDGDVTSDWSKGADSVKTWGEWLYSRDRPSEFPNWTEDQ